MLDAMRNVPSIRSWHSGRFIKFWVVLETAKLRCGATSLIKLDLTNFFESILEPQVYELFRSFGYQPLVAFELSRLCTRVRASSNPDQRHGNKPLPPGLPPATPALATCPKEPRRLRGLPIWSCSPWTRRCRPMRQKMI